MSQPETTAATVSLPEGEAEVSSEPAGEQKSERRIQREKKIAPTGGLAAVPLPNRIMQYRRRLPEIAAWEPIVKLDTDSQLRKRSLSLRYRARSGEKLVKLLGEAYAVVREAGRRTLNMRHFDVQLIGGIAMFHGCIAEMETGEGKTLTATLAMYLRALSGKGAHLATVNDYLAERDAELMKPIYTALGLSIGVVKTQISQDERREAYGSDITYGTAKEFGFDFLRDRLLLRRIGESALGIGGNGAIRADATEKPVQRGMHSVLVDEADSILIDEARTPLIISAVPGEAQQRAVACYRWASSLSLIHI